MFVHLCLINCCRAKTAKNTYSTQEFGPDHWWNPTWWHTDRSEAILSLRCTKTVASRIYSIQAHRYTDTLIRGLSKWNPVSLFACQKYLNVEVILISESVNSEIRITSTFRAFWQANRISFRKTSINSHIRNPLIWNYHWAIMWGHWCSPFWDLDLGWIGSLFEFCSLICHK